MKRLVVGLKGRKKTTKNIDKGSIKGKRTGGGSETTPKTPMTGTGRENIPLKPGQKTVKM